MPHHPLQPRRSLKLAPLLLVAILAACSGSDDDEATDTTPTTEAAQSGTTTVTTDDDTTTTVEAEGPPEWVDVARDVFERSFALRTDPNLDSISDVYSETCECWQGERDTVQFLIDNHERVEGRPADILLVRHELTDPETGLVNLTVKAQTSALRRVSDDGSVAQEIPGEDPSCVAYALLSDGPDDAYRVYSKTALPDCPDEAT